MSKSVHNSKPENCLNCGHALRENYDFCPHCGQKDLPERLTLSYFVHEFLNNYFSFDSKFFRTIVPLITKPSFLTQEFIDGRRIRYINPIQFFVFISFLFFLVDSFMILKEVSDKKDFVVMNSNGETISSDSLDTILSKEKLEVDTKDKLKEFDGVESGVKDFIKKSQKFNEMDRDEQNERISKMISYFIFLLMPLFALFLNWFYGERHRHYLENLIFSLHFHSFFFLTGTFFMLFDRIIPDPYDSYLFGIIILGYLLIALKLFYTNRWLSTIWRFTGLFFAYGFMVILIYLFSIVISILI